MGMKLPRVRPGASRVGGGHYPWRKSGSRCRSARRSRKKTVQVAKESPDLTTAIEWRGQELGPSRAEELEGTLTVAHPKNDLRADPMGIVGHRQGNGRLVRRWLASGNEQQPVPHEIQHYRCAAILSEHRGARDIDIPVTTDCSIGHHQQVRQCFRLEPIHAVHTTRRGYVSAVPNGLWASFSPPARQEPGARSQECPVWPEGRVLALVGLAQHLAPPASRTTTATTLAGADG